jgi:hypothetical protein
VQPPTRAALRGIAGAAGGEMVRLAAEHTPKRSGRTAEAWRQLPVRRTRYGPEVAYVSGAENPSYKARFLEYGTDPHEIEPRRADAIDTPEGPRAKAEHPGTEGHHMLARAAEEVDATLGSISQPHLSEWAAAIEERAKRHPGID